MKFISKLTKKKRKYPHNRIEAIYYWLFAFLAACYELTFILCFFLFNIVIIRGK